MGGGNLIFKVAVWPTDEVCVKIFYFILFGSCCVLWKLV